LVVGRLGCGVCVDLGRSSKYAPPQKMVGRVRRSRNAPRGMWERVAVLMIAKGSILGFTIQ
jgi:hypothetical protein